MFNLELKGFNPIKNLSVSSENNLLCFVGDDTIGAEVLRDVIVSVQESIAELPAKNFLDVEYNWHTKLSNKLALAWTFNDQKYTAELSRNKNGYSFNNEVGFIGDKQLFTRTDKVFNDKHNLVDNNQTSWMLDTDTIKALTSLKAIKQANCCHTLVRFTWNELLVRQFAIGDCIKESIGYPGVVGFVNKNISKLLPSIQKMELVRDKEVNEYEYIRFKLKEKEEYPTRYSSKVWNVALLLTQIQLGANILWHPDSLLNQDEIKKLFKILRTQERPYFVFLKSPVVNEECYKVTGDQSKVVVHSVMLAKNPISGTILEFN